MIPSNHISSKFTASIQREANWCKSRVFANRGLWCHAATSPLLNLTRHDMRRQKFTPTPEEVTYWKRIHQLNEAERKPEPVQFIIHTIEIVKAEEVR